MTRHLFKIINKKNTFWTTWKKIDISSVLNTHMDLGLTLPGYKIPGLPPPSSCTYFPSNSSYIFIPLSGFCLLNICDPLCEKVNGVILRQSEQNGCCLLIFAIILNILNQDADSYFHPYHAYFRPPLFSMSAWLLCTLRRTPRFHMRDALKNFVNAHNHA